MPSDDRQDPKTPPAATLSPAAGAARPDPEPGSAPPPAQTGELLAEASDQERAQAASFAKLVDQLVAGQSLPPAMTAEQRELIETAGMVRAGSREVALAPARRDRLVDDVLGRALAAAMPAELGPDAVAPASPGEGAEQHPSDGAGESSDDADAPADVPSDIIDLGERRRGRFARILPWSVAAASVAAALVLALWQARTKGLPPSAPTVAQVDRDGLEIIHRSRPADALVGEIPRARAGEARARIDMIYADRLRGYRDLRLRGGRL
ncbi:hypothetical protein [Haliangium sp.]|uniref:hypothetical protein n=1 Tax=Haliangium sp. TaxID=2663208 RepID=UPI003D0C46AA